MSENILLIFQIILGIALTGLILIQSKGMGLGAAFGSRIGQYSTRRGVEKTVFSLTIILAVLFFLVSVLQLIF
jgi:preprotein translocase subunit SecG